MIRVERPRQPEGTPMVGLHLAHARVSGHVYVFVWDDAHVAATAETLVRYMAEPSLRFPVAAAVAIVLKHPSLKRPFFLLCE